MTDRRFDAFKKISGYTYILNLKNENYFLLKKNPPLEMSLLLINPQIISNNELRFNSGNIIIERKINKLLITCKFLYISLAPFEVEPTEDFFPLLSNWANSNKSFLQRSRTKRAFKSLF